MMTNMQNVNWIACQGEKGACGHNVTRRDSFVRDNFEAAPQPTYEEVFELLGDGRSSRAVVAIHNSRTGNIIEPMTLLAQYRFGVIDELYHQINHCLMVTAPLAERFGVHDPASITGAQRAAILSAIVEVRSDEQGLRQCKDYITRALPRAAPITMLCTATAAKSIKTDADDLAQEVRHQPYGEQVAAVAGAYCAEMYGLVIIERNVQDHGANNVTRYIVMEKSPRSEKDVTRDFERQLLASALGEGEEGGFRPAAGDQLRQLKELSGLAKKKGNQVILARDRILAEPGGFKLAAKVHLLAQNGLPQELRKHNDFANLGKVAKLLELPTLEHTDGPMGLGRHKKGPPPFEEAGRGPHREAFDEAKRELGARLKAARKAKRPGPTKPIDRYRTFVYVRAPSRGRTILGVLQPLIANQQIQIELMQILPPQKPGEGESAILEVHGQAYFRKDGKAAVHGPLERPLAEVKRNAHGPDKKSSGALEILGCFMARDVDESLDEGRMADAEFDEPGSPIRPRRSRGF